MDRRQFLTSMAAVALSPGSASATGEQATSVTSIGGDCTPLPLELFSLGGRAVLREGRVVFQSDNALATITADFGGLKPTEPQYNSDDAGQQPPAGNRYYVYVQSDRNRHYRAMIRVGRELLVPESTGEIKGVLWEKFTPLVLDHLGKMELQFSLGSGAVLQRVLIVREPYSYWLADALPKDLRGEIEADLRRFVRPPRARQVGSGTVLSFEPPDRDIHCMAWDGKYVWCGFSLAPSALLRVNPVDLSTRRIVFKGSSGLHSLTCDGYSLWAIHLGHNPVGKNNPEGWFGLSRIDVETGEYETFRVGDGSGGGYCATFDGHRLWVGVYRQPACAVAVDTKGRLVRRVEIPDTPRRCFRSIHFDGRYVWGGLLTRPGRIIRIDPDSGDLKVYVLNRGEDNINSVCSDGRYVWAGLETRPAKIVRLDPAAGTHKSITLNRNEDFCRTVVAAKGRIYAALYCTPATVVALNPQFGRTGTWRLGPGEDHARAAVYDGRHLWVGLAMNRWNPGQLWKLNG